MNPAAGFCAHCGAECGDKLAEHYFERCHPDRYGSVVFVCPRCPDAYVGTHAATTKQPHAPLGTAADPELRRARQVMHARFDGLWKSMVGLPCYDHARDLPLGSDERRKAFAIINRTSRRRAYDFLGWHMGLSVEDCHIAMFDLDRCRAAWAALRGVTPAAVRAWAHEQKRRRRAAEAAAGKASKDGDDASAEIGREQDVRDDAAQHEREGDVPVIP